MTQYVSPDFQYPQEHIKACLEMNDDPDGLLEFLNKESLMECIKCQGSKTRWIYFISPEWTWRMECGRESYLLYCTDCGWISSELPISLN